MRAPTHSTGRERSCSARAELLGGREDRAEDRAVEARREVSTTQEGRGDRAARAAHKAGTPNTVLCRAGVQAEGRPAECSREV